MTWSWSSFPYRVRGELDASDHRSELFVISPRVFDGVYERPNNDEVRLYIETREGHADTALF